MRRKLITHSSSEKELAAGRLRVAVEAKVGFDAADSLFVYTYMVVNEPDGMGTVRWFSLWPIPEVPARWTAPDHWEAGPAYKGSEARGFVWWVSAPDSGTAAGIESTPYMSARGAVPGDTLTGFSISLPISPTSISYLIQVWVDDPDSAYAVGRVTDRILGPGGREE